jgi:hypothetical protein
MTARPESALLEPLLEQLGMRQAAAVLPDWLDRAASQKLSYADFLHGLLEEESVARANAATQKRLRQAGFPYATTIDSSTSASVPSSSGRSSSATSTPPSSSKLGRWRWRILPQGTFVSTQRSGAGQRIGRRGSYVHQRHR